MTRLVPLLTALLLTPLIAPAQITTTPATTSIVGDGAHDETAAIQALLDSRRALAAAQDSSATKETRGAFLLQVWQQQ